MEKQRKLLIQFLAGYIYPKNHVMVLQNILLWDRVANTHHTITRVSIYILLLWHQTIDVVLPTDICQLLFMEEKETAIKPSPLSEFYVFLGWQYEVDKNTQHGPLVG